MSAAITLETVVGRHIPSRNRPSFFAPPLAWAIAEFTRALMAGAGAPVPAHTGLIVVSDECSLATIRDLSRMAAGGAISPLRFAGASPSIVAGLAALENGLRGPTVALTMRPEHAAAAIAAMIRSWMSGHDLAAVIVVAHYADAERGHVFKGLIARPGDDGAGPGVFELTTHPCAAENASSPS